VTIDGSDVGVAGLQDVANYLVLPVSGLDGSCQPYNSTSLMQPLYPPLNGECNDALRLGLQAEIDTIQAGTRPSTSALSPAPTTSAPPATSVR
jgi:hypothetical protein